MSMAAVSKKKWHQKLMVQMSVAIASLFLIIEAILLIGSYNSKKSEYAEISEHVSQRILQNPQQSIADPLGTNFVKQKLDRFILNVTLLTLIIVVVVVGGTLCVFHLICVRHLLFIRQINQQTTGKDVFLIPSADIPGNEIGDIMKFRNQMLTDLMETREQVTQVAKMSALGEMAGGVAHEINSPLAIIRMRVEQMEEFIAEGDVDPTDLKDAIDMIKNTTSRIAKIVSGLLSFSRDGRQDVAQKIKVSEIITETLSLCSERFANNGVQLDVVKDNLYESLEIECRSVEISQALLNLLNNAFDAIEKNKTKWVRINVCDVGNHIEMSVTDSGPGISSHIREKLMQPFFTTKDIGKGTGLGLSISKGIVEAHKGKIRLDNDSPNTKFVVFLPKMQMARETTGAAA